MLRLVLMLVTVVLAYLMILLINPIRDFALRYHKVVVLNLQLLYSKYQQLDLKLDRNPKFQNEVTRCAEQHFKDDTEAELFFINPHYTPQTAVNAPSYFVKLSGKNKPVVQPQDPRFTLLVYLQWIRKHPGEKVPFHWSDWVNLFDIYKYILLPAEKKPNCTLLFDLLAKPLVIKGLTMRPVDEYCHDDPKHPLGFTVSGFPVSQTRNNMRLLGKLFLYLSFASPAKLIFLTDEQGSYTVDVDNYKENDVKNSLLQNGMVEEVLHELHSNKLDAVQAYKLLLKLRKPENADGVMKEPVLHLSEDMFYVDAQKELEGVKSQGDSLSPMDENYLDMLEYLTNTETPHKYFDEAKLVNLDLLKVYGEHHDWRFFNGLTINTDQQTLALHRLIKNYLHFCRTHGLVTWIAHGLLLLWYWNGMAFPWDADTDAQMPIRDLYRLGREFNQTLVVENTGMNGEFVGTGSFFIDVGSSITHRERGNGMNNIDARFIDIATGLYVDITGLAASEEPAPSRYDFLLQNHKPGEEELETQRNMIKQTYNCRNRHFALLLEVLPLVMSSVQNQLGYVPLNFGLLLDHEYQTKGLIVKNFQDYTYVSSLRIWIPDKVLLEYARDPETFGSMAKRGLLKKERKTIENFNADDMAALMRHKWIFREYVLTRKFTDFHNQQMTRFLRNTMGEYQKHILQYASLDDVNRPLWGDTFMAGIETNGIRYDEEVDRIGELEELLNT